MIDLRIKETFFDRPKVARAVDRAKRQALSRAGAFIRTRARSSIRSRKRTSRPGEPPSSHTGLLRRFILFGYDRRTDSVVVGPVGFRGSDAPHVLEFGGKTVIYRRRQGRLVRQQVRIAARPYMAPAFARERTSIPRVWHGSIRGG